MPVAERGFKEVDFRIGFMMTLSIILYYIAVGINLGVETYVSAPILVIAVAFLADTSYKASLKAGITRFMVTFVGVVVGLAVLILYDLTGQNQPLEYVYFAVGAVLTLVLTKYCKVMYIHCRIATVSYILTVWMFHDAFYASIGKTCYGYALMWVITTALAVVLTVACMFIWDKIKALIAGKK